GEIESARGHQGRPLAEAVAGHRNRLKGRAGFGESAVDRDRGREQSRLGVRGQVQLVLRPLEAEAGERQAEGGVRLLEGRAGRRGNLGPGSPHADLLRALAGEDEGLGPFEDAHSAGCSSRAAGPPSRLSSCWCTSASFSLIFSCTRASENSTARRMAFRIARAVERPWPMKQPPSTPRSGAAPYSV